jgi:hypothetical protein
MFKQYNQIVINFKDSILDPITEDMLKNIRQDKNYKFDLNDDQLRV